MSAAGGFAPLIHDSHCKPWGHTAARWWLETTVAVSLPNPAREGRRT
jgi:hypothetical protein